MSDCRHLDASIEGSFEQGFAWCPDCRKMVPLWVCIKNLLDEVRAKIAEMDSALARSNWKPNIEGRP